MNYNPKYTLNWLHGGFIAIVLFTLSMNISVFPNSLKPNPFLEIGTKGFLTGKIFAEDILSGKNILSNHGALHGEISPIFSYNESVYISPGISINNREFSVDDNFDIMTSLFLINAGCCQSDVIYCYQ